MLPAQHLRQASLLQLVTCHIHDMAVRVILLSSGAVMQLWQSGGTAAAAIGRIPLSAIAKLEFPAEPSNKGEAMASYDCSLPLQPECHVAGQGSEDAPVLHLQLVYSVSAAPDESALASSQPGILTSGQEDSKSYHLFPSAFHCSVPGSQMLRCVQASEQFEDARHMIFEFYH